MKILKHILILFVLAASMTVYLYSYKPRHYELHILLGNFLLNFYIWLAIFGIPYAMVAGLIVAIRRRLTKN